jgi:hypothetical protein
VYHYQWHGKKKRFLLDVGSVDDEKRFAEFELKGVQLPTEQPEAPGSPDSSDLHDDPMDVPARSVRDREIASVTGNALRGLMMESSHHAKQAPPSAPVPISIPGERARPRRINFYGVGVGILAVMASGALVKLVPGSSPPLARQMSWPATRPPTPDPSTAQCDQGMVFITGGQLPRESKTSIASFCIDLHEVNVDAYRKCVEAGHCEAPLPAGEVGKFEPYSKGAACNWERASNEQYLSHPINCVTWEQAERFCRERQSRLPTSLEWELTGQNTTTRKSQRYPWGNEPPGNRPCWSGGELIRAAQGLTTCAVTEMKHDVSPSGVFDLGGNVMEWVNEKNTVKGGSWRSQPEGPPGVVRLPLLKNDQHLPFPANHARDYVGFRCASDAKPPQNP